MADREDRLWEPAEAPGKRKGLQGLWHWYAHLIDRVDVNALDIVVWMSLPFAVGGAMGSVLYYISSLVH